ncbi:proton-conducting transporter membrane subunit [Thalassobaculum sp.]|uniref:proton-conducting transporter transmembrane domain-containing protein n=1 Tax=Thalassobaculum sp. TaxID=2022740 RepID=UPI003B5B6BA5
MSWLLVAPILLPLLGAIVAALFGRRRALARGTVVAVCALMTASAVALMVEVWRAGMLSMAVGSWVAPFGIVLAADHLSAILTVITGITGLAVSIYAIADIDRAREARGYHALFLVLLAGVNGAFLTGDLFNLYVWFEVMLIASFGMIALGRTREELDGAVRYLALNMVATLMFLMAIALLFGSTGTLNLAHLYIVVSSGQAEGAVLAAGLLLAMAFGMKAAVFPVFFWLPASYHTPAFAVSAIFAGLLTKVGVYALIRVFTLVFAGQEALVQAVFWPVAAATMVVGVLGAASQSEIRRILSFHIVSQIGYMLVGLALLTPIALTAAVFYLIHHIVVKANLFLVAGVIHRYCRTNDLARTGGLVGRAPWLAVLFLVPALSLAGIPPLSGFWAKLLVVQASIDAADLAMAAIALVVGLFTVYSMIKIWNEAFWKAPPEAAVAATASGSQIRILCAPVAMLAILTICVGLGAGPALELAERASAELLDPVGYARAVLGDPQALADATAHGGWR